MYTYTAVQLEHKTFGELKSIARELDIVPSGDRRCRQAWIDAIVGVELPLLALIENSPGVDSVQKPESIAHELLDLFKSSVANLVEPIESQVQEPIAPAVETSPGVTFSDTFLACYFPPQPEIHYQADADGQLTLLDFEVAATDEPPDPDDFACLDDFFEAMTAWDAENLEPLEISLDSMVYWSCPSDWYEPPDTGIFARLPGPKPPKFPSRAIGQTDDIASVSSSHSGRSPPGGDAVF